jgi:hypothetical protein
MDLGESCLNLIYRSKEYVMDANFIILFYLLMLGLFGTLIWIIMLQRDDASDPQKGIGGGQRGLDEIFLLQMEEPKDD